MTKKQFLENSAEFLGEEGSFMAERLFKLTSFSFIWSTNQFPISWTSCHKNHHASKGVWRWQEWHDGLWGVCSCHQLHELIGPPGKSQVTNSKQNIDSTITWYFSSRSWIFDVFDEDGGGTIELDEVIKLVRQSRRCTLESLNQYVQLTPPGLF